MKNVAKSRSTYIDNKNKALLQRKVYDIACIMYYFVKKKCQLYVKSLCYLIVYYILEIYIKHD